MRNSRSSGNAVTPKRRERKAAHGQKVCRVNGVSGNRENASNYATKGASYKPRHPLSAGSAKRQAAIALATDRPAQQKRTTRKLEAKLSEIACRIAKKACASRSGGGSRAASSTSFDRIS